MTMLRCPECGSEQFFGKIIYGGVCSVEKDSEGKTITKVLQQGQDCVAQVKACANPNCSKNKGLSIDELIDTVPCKTCGTLYDPKDLDKDGNCPVCSALAGRDDLKNASKEDLIRMILNLEHGSGVNTKKEKIDAKTKAADATKETVEAKKQEILKQADKINDKKTENKPDEAAGDSNKTAEKPKKGRPASSSKKVRPAKSEEKNPPKTEVAPENTAPETSEAPFPEVNTKAPTAAMNPPEEAVPEPKKEEPFKMFDNEPSTDDSNNTPF